MEEIRGVAKMQIIVHVTTHHINDSCLCEVCKKELHVFNE